MINQRPNRTYVVVLLLFASSSIFSAYTVGTTLPPVDSAKNFTINISEQITMDESVGPAQSSTKIHYDQGLGQKMLKQHEGDVVVTVIQNSKVQATIDRISNQERLRFSGKSFTYNPAEQTYKLSTLDNRLATSQSNQASILQGDPILFHSSHVVSVYKTLVNLIQDRPAIQSINPPYLLLLLPLGGYALVRYQGTRIIFSKFLSFCFVLITCLLPFRYLKWYRFVSHLLYEFLDIRGGW